MANYQYRKDLNYLSIISTWLDNLTFNWDDLLDYGRKINLEKGDNLFYFEETVNNIYIVLSGRIRIYLITSKGKEKTIAVIGRNGLLGEQILQSNNTHITNGSAVTRSILLEIDKNIFMKKVLENELLTKQWLEMLSLKLELLTHVSIKLTYENSLINIVNAFLELANTYGERQGNGSIKISISFTHQELADLIGSSRVTVSNTIKLLNDSNVIFKRKGYYYINDIDKLFEYSQ